MIRTLVIRSMVAALVLAGCISGPERLPSPAGDGGGPVGDGGVAAGTLIRCDAEAFELAGSEPITAITRFGDRLGYQQANSRLICSSGDLSAGIVGSQQCVPASSVSDAIGARIASSGSRVFGLANQCASEPQIGVVRTDFGSTSCVELDTTGPGSAVEGVSALEAVDFGGLGEGPDFVILGQEKQASIVDPDTENAPSPSVLVPATSANLQALSVVRGSGPSNRLVAFFETLDFAVCSGPSSCLGYQCEIAGGAPCNLNNAALAPERDGQHTLAVETGDAISVVRVDSTFVQPTVNLDELGAFEPVARVEDTMYWGRLASCPNTVDPLLADLIVVREDRGMFTVRVFFDAGSTTTACEQSVQFNVGNLSGFDAVVAGKQLWIVATDRRLWRIGISDDQGRCQR